MPRKPDPKGTLISSNGQIHFNTVSGTVTGGNGKRAFGKTPKKIDVEEWKRRYPDEHHLLAAQNDILDFGIWWTDGSYEPPCEDWRKDREENIRLDNEWEEEQRRLAEAEHGRAMQEVV